MFDLNQNVVYPGYGVARVNRIIERMVGAQIEHFYELKFLHKDMTILVPVANMSAVGLRTLSSHACVELVFKLLSNPILRNSGCGEVLSSWNKRNKKYQALLRSGDLVEISKIYRDLQYLAQTKELSFGERTLLAQTETLLAEEIAMVSHVVPEQAVLQMRAFFGPARTVVQKQARQAL